MNRAMHGGRGVYTCSINKISLRGDQFAAMIMASSPPTNRKIRAVAMY